jgi:hypothetical protein
MIGASRGSTPRCHVFGSWLSLDVVVRAPAPPPDRHIPETCRHKVIGYTIGSLSDDDEINTTLSEGSAKIFTALPHRSPDIDGVAT